MTINVRTAVVLLILTAGVAACGGDVSPPSAVLAPSPTPPVVPPVVPQPTAITVNGGVVDSAFRPLSGALVEILDGALAGKSAVTGTDGRFTFIGEFDDTTRFRATSEGHVTATQTLQPMCSTCSVSNRWVYFALAVFAPPVDIAGEYTLSLSAASSCTEIPGELRSRTYAATITPQTDSRSPANTNFLVNLSGATFLGDYYRSFSIGVAGDFVAMWFNGEGPGLVEEVGPNTYIGFDGHAEASVGTSRVTTISASFDGWVDYCALRAPMGQYYDCRSASAITRVECQSQSHQLVLTRR